MSLRCLIGHNFDPPETEHEREERGAEVVVTVREFKACSRCGERQIISENKEVRTTSTPQSDTPDTAEISPTADPVSPPTEDAHHEDVTAAEDDGIILPDEEPDERREGEWPEDEEEPEESDVEPAAWPDSGQDPSPEPEPSTTAAWPEREDIEERPSDAGEGRPWPIADGEDEGFDAVAGDDASVEDVEFGGGLTPQRTDETNTGAESSTSDDSDTAEIAPAGITSVSPGPEPTGPQLSEASGGSLLVCPECDHEASGEVTSHRPGDICPECRRGYLTEK